MFFPCTEGGSICFSFRNRDDESITIFQTPGFETSSQERYRDKQYDDGDADDLKRKRKACSFREFFQ